MAILDNIPGWKVFSAGVGIAALCVAGYFAWYYLLKEEQDLKPLQEQALAHALEQLAAVYVDKVRLEGEQRLVVMPVRGDTTNRQVRRELLKRLNTIEGVRADVPRDPTLEERAGAVIRGVMRKEESLPDPTAVFEQSGEADEVLSVNVDRIWSGADSGICTLDLYRIVRASSLERTASVADPQRIKGVSGTATADGAVSDDEEPGTWSMIGGFLWRMLAVLAATAVLPLMAWPLARAAFKADSNAANAALLGGLTLLDLLVLLALAGFTFSTTAIVSAALLLPAALLYNLRMLNLMEES